MLPATIRTPPQLLSHLKPIMEVANWIQLPGWLTDSLASCCTTQGRFIELRGTKLEKLSQNSNVIQRGTVSYKSQSDIENKVTFLLRCVFRCLGSKVIRTIIKL